MWAVAHHGRGSRADGSAWPLPCVLLRLARLAVVHVVATHFLGDTIVPKALFQRDGRIKEQGLDGCCGGRGGRGSRLRCCGHSCRNGGSRRGVGGRRTVIGHPRHGFEGTCPGLWVVARATKQHFVSHERATQAACTATDGAWLEDRPCAPGGGDGALGSGTWRLRSWNSSVRFDSWACRFFFQAAMQRE